MFGRVMIISCILKCSVYSFKICFFDIIFKFAKHYDGILELLGFSVLLAIY